MRVQYVAKGGLHVGLQIMIEHDRDRSAPQEVAIVHVEVVGNIDARFPTESVEG